MGIDAQMLIRVPRIVTAADVDRYPPSSGARTRTTPIKHVGKPTTNRNE